MDTVFTLLFDAAKTQSKQIAAQVESYFVLNFQNKHIDLIYLHQFG